MVVTTQSSPFNINLNHGVTQLNNVISYPTKALYSVRKYSINNALLVSAMNTWVQFSLAYIAVVMITSNDLSFLTDILSLKLMSLYPFVSVILAVIFFSSLALKYFNKQKIKAEGSIDKRMRGGKSNEISEVAQNALTIEIIANLDGMVNNKQNLSIVLPIFGKQVEILKSKRQENRNKVILLTVPYILSIFIVISALGKFGFIYVQGCEEILFILLVLIFDIICTLMTLSRLRNNTIDHQHNIVQEFDIPSILSIFYPFIKYKIMSIMENKLKNEKEDDPLSRFLKLFDDHLSNFTNETCSLLKNNFLNPLGKSIVQNIEEVKALSMQEVKKLREELNKDIKCKLEEFKFQPLIDLLTDRIESFKPGYLIGTLSGTSRLQKSEQADENISIQTKNPAKKPHPCDPDVNISSDYYSCIDEEDVPDNQLGSLTKEKRVKEKQKKIKNLSHNQTEEDNIKDWQDKINGSASEFFDYMLKSIKLKIKNDQGKEVKIKNDQGQEVDPTLRNFDNKIIVHWKDCSKTTCYINKKAQIHPNTKINFAEINFADNDINQAWLRATV